MSDCVIIGAGPGGLAVGGALAQRGRTAVLLEAEDAVGARWRGRYDRLRINTSSLTSFLPGRRFPLRYGRWPSRDQLVAYYEAYARDHGLDVRAGVRVERVDREGDGWIVRSPGGAFAARSVVVATGKDNVPRVPEWPGREGFAGRVLHSAEYRSPAPFRGQHAVVVGAGSSAVDVALDLLEGGAASVAVSVRRVPHLFRKAMGPVPSDLAMVASSRVPHPVVDAVVPRLRRLTIGDLAPYGLPAPEDRFTERVLVEGMIPVIDPGGFVPAVKRGDVRIVGAVEALDGDAVVLAGGERHEAQVVVACTGYDRGLERLVGHLGVLDDRGRPHARRGLHFIGQTDELTGNLRQIRLDAKRIAAAVAADGTGIMRA